MNPRVLILAGGFGTRLAKVVSDVPKPMAPVRGKPLLEYQIEFLRRQGFDRFTLLTGHLAEKIEAHFGDGRAFGVAIDYSVETNPLGTGGAVRRAMLTHADEDAFLILNGDGLFATDYQRFVRHARGPLSLAVKYSRDLSRYGAVEFDEGYVVRAFREKTGLTGDGFINAGAYLIRRQALELFKDQPHSIETDVFTLAAARGDLTCVPCGGKFVDIGTPESYAWSQDHLPAWLNETPRPCLFLDRDGVIVKHKPYLHEPCDVEFVPETIELMRTARAAGWWLVVVTNQAGVGRGLFTEAQYDECQRHIEAGLNERGVAVNKWFACFTHPTHGAGAYRVDSPRRKPDPGMLLEAGEILPIDYARSVMIGDNQTDQIRLPGLRTCLVQGDFKLEPLRDQTQTFGDMRALVGALSPELN